MKRNLTKRNNNSIHATKDSKEKTVYFNTNNGNKIVPRAMNRPRIWKTLLLEKEFENYCQI